MKPLITCCTFLLLLMMPGIASSQTVITLAVGDAYPDFAMMQAAAERYSLIDSSISVRLLLMPAVTDDRLDLVSNFMDVMSPQLDILNLDIVWLHQLSGHLADLGPLGLTAAGSGLLPVAAQLGTVDGSLLAIPWYLQVGMLYYRPDLLQKYGYPAPPATPQELAAMAAAIQAGERAAGNADFWGYVWQGAPYEGLTANLVEWLDAAGAGSLVEPHGSISVGNPGSVAAVQNAMSWVGSISPPGVLGYTEAEALEHFLAGDSAFMRGWAGQWNRVSPIGMATSLPNDSGVLGGATLAVSRYSHYPGEAARVVEFLTSPREQLIRARDGGLPPVSVSLLDDPAVTASLPFLQDIRASLIDPVQRPSAVAGELYAAVSRSTYNGVHEILTGRVPAASGLARLATGLQFFTGFPLEP